MDITTMSLHDKMAIVQIFQGLGLFLWMLTGVQTVAARVASVETKQNLCALGLVTTVISQIRFFFAISTWIDVWSLSAGGMYFNLCLGCGQAVLYGLGARLS